ncbi:MAG: hypothetical protein SNJ33_05025 [Rikenellaceae bacterium]
MKLKFLLLFALVLSLGTLSASAQKFEKGSTYLTATVGVGGYGLPIAVQYEKGVYDINENMSIGVGGYAGIAFYNSSSLFAIAANGTYHYTQFESWDLYGAVRLGFEHWGWSSYSGFLWGANVGARYFFNEKFAVAAEFGYGVSYANIGVTYAF